MRPSGDRPRFDLTGYPQRRSIRLKDYDYSSAGGYFVTFVTQDRSCLFGEIIEGTMALGAAGRMIQVWWERLPARYGVSLDQFIVMPNHFHGIVLLPDPDTESLLAGIASDGVGAKADRGTGAHVGAPLQQIVRWFKTMTTNDYIRGVRELAWTAFNQRLWQRNYYDRVIRNEAELLRIRKYICDNPALWDLDEENPTHW